MQGRDFLPYGETHVARRSEVRADLVLVCSPRVARQIREEVEPFSLDDVMLQCAGILITSAMWRVKGSGGAPARSNPKRASSVSMTCSSFRLSIPLDCILVFVGLYHCTHSTTRNMLASRSTVVAALAIASTATAQLGALTQGLSAGCVTSATGLITSDFVRWTLRVFRRTNAADFGFRPAFCRPAALA